MIPEAPKGEPWRVYPELADLEGSAAAIAHAAFHRGFEAGIEATVRAAAVELLGPLEENRCPDCGGESFVPGPRGGAAQNIRCANCNSCFNVVRLEGRVVMAHRIPYRGEW